MILTGFWIVLTGLSMNAIAETTVAANNSPLILNGDNPDWLVEHPEWLVDSPEWPVDNPDWLVDNLDWPVDNPDWRVDNPDWPVYECYC